MVVSREKTVAAYVTENIKTAHIFKKHGIDFCCGGAVTVEKACKKNNVDQAILEKELSEVDKVVDKLQDFDSWSLDFLIVYIENLHHTYVRESLPLLSQYANKVAKVHGHHYEEVVIVNKLFHEVANELISHMQKEEQILFPFINQLVDAKKKKEVYKRPPFGTVNNPIKMMEHEHENAGGVLKEIARLTNNYTPPEGACNTFKALYAKLEEFEQDLHQHIHLENNILHPKAIKLEKELTAS
ncbi:iron-sulfur cluster repair di-iron protein [uncultured Tenacibaculum sp.]|uniref:iron-sulfur cluster repair di-iron protein n=1 Tax=uncultured Tenacibaculum sp. TaxID=174713 RepID=UPI002632883F|nr:iron-sulfur cluster repair di-iron protein [uncultured Tenacibaculum sp.]